MMSSVTTASTCVRLARRWSRRRAGFRRRSKASGIGTIRSSRQVGLLTERSRPVCEDARAAKKIEIRPLTPAGASESQRDISNSALLPVAVKIVRYSCREGLRLCCDSLGHLLGHTGARWPPGASTSHPRCRCDPPAVRNRLAAGGRWIRTIGPAVTSELYWRGPPLLPARERERLARFLLLS
jgi:hypothetical protein